VELVFLSKMFPFKTTYSVDDEVRRHVRARLPSREVAWELAHQYYGHIAWTYVFLLNLHIPHVYTIPEPTLYTGQNFSTTL